MNILFVYFINTGCLVYPAKFTCFENLSWSLTLAEVDKMNLHYENWSKAGHTPTSKVENPVDHVKFFNWLPNWFKIYFFTKVSDLIFGIIFTIIVLITFFYKKNKISLKKDMKNNYLIIMMFFIFLIEWFYNHPALRYGGYCLIAILFFPFFNFFRKI